MKQPVDSPSMWSAVAGIARDLGAGDPSALIRLYDVTASRLLRYAETLTRHRADAEDALQSALMNVSQRPRQLALADRPWPYLLQVVRHESLKIIEKRRRAISLAQLLRKWRPVACAVEVEESRQQVHDAIHQLPPEQAEVVLLKIWEELTFAEIAELIGQSPNTVASRYRYALEKLARSLESLAGLVADDALHSTVATDGAIQTTEVRDV